MVEEMVEDMASVEQCRKIGDEVEDEAVVELGSETVDEVGSEEGGEAS